jgi:hypothetical protein
MWLSPSSFRQAMWDGIEQNMGITHAAMCSKKGITERKLHVSLQGGEIRLDVPLVENGRYVQHDYCLGCRRFEGKRTFPPGPAPETPIVWIRCSPATITKKA